MPEFDTSFQLPEPIMFDRFPPAKRLGVEDSPLGADWLVNS